MEARRRAARDAQPCARELGDTIDGEAGGAQRGLEPWQRARRIAHIDQPDGGLGGAQVEDAPKLDLGHEGLGRLARKAGRAERPSRAR